MPSILDVAIGTVFVFLLFSIVVTALNEIVLSFFDKRADFLRLVLGEMLSDPQKGNVPSYFEELGAYFQLTWKSAIAWVTAVLIGIQAVSGWALTALAASLGVPFWFDLSQRFMNIRANGRWLDEKQLISKKTDSTSTTPDSIHTGH